MNNEPQPPASGGGILTKLEWGVVLSLIISASSIIFSAGIVWTTVQQHDREIVALKMKSDENTDRLARIETKLDLLLEERKQQTP